MGLPFPLAVVAALVTAPILLLLIYLGGCFAIGCKQGVVDAFRHALAARR
jgi:hypothetical protein